MRLEIIYEVFTVNRGRLENPPGTPVEIVTPYTTAGSSRPKMGPVMDVMHIVHPSCPRKIARLTPTSFSLSTLDFRDGSNLDENGDNYNSLLSSSTDGATTTVTASTALFAATGMGVV